MAKPTHRIALDLLAENRLAELFALLGQALSHHEDSQLAEDYLLLSARYHAWTRDEQQGKEPGQPFVNRLRGDTLKLIKAWEKELPPSPERKKAPLSGLDNPNPRQVHLLEKIAELETLKAEWESVEYLNGAENPTKAKQAQYHIAYLNRQLEKYQEELDLSR